MAKHDFLLPDVGEGLEGGTILQWLVAEGDRVSVDQLIVEIETDKAVVEIPSPVNGQLLQQGAPAGSSLRVGAILATFDESNPQPAPNHNAAPASAAANTNSAPTIRQSARVLASPATRRFARQRNVDLGQLTGSGSRGQITNADVQAFITASQQTSVPNEPNEPIARAATAKPPALIAGQSRREPLSGLRKQIATNMQTAWRDIPHIFSFEEMDASKLIDARTQINQELQTQDQRISFMPLFVKACVIALQEHPRFNASLSLQDDSVVYHGHCNIGIATSTPEGLIVTVVHHAEQKSLQQIGAEIQDLSALARQRKVSVEQIRGGTFTISNFGSYGGTLGTPVIRPPEVAIAGFGRIHQKVVVVDGAPAVRSILPLAISTDHRLNDGEHLGGFVNTLKRVLGNPLALLAHL